MAVRSAALVGAAQRGDPRCNGERLPARRRRRENSVSNVTTLNPKLKVRQSDLDSRPHYPMVEENVHKSNN